LLFGVISGGVTARKTLWGLLGLALVEVAAFYSIACASGYEAVSTGINPRPWWMTFGILVIALLGYVLSGAKLFRIRSSTLAKKISIMEGMFEQRFSA
jgi:hypothetical protein